MDLISFQNHSSIYFFFGYFEKSFRNLKTPSFLAQGVLLIKDFFLGVFLVQLMISYFNSTELCNN